MLTLQFRNTLLSVLSLCVMIFIFTQTQHNSATAESLVDSQTLNVSASCETYVEVEASNGLHTQFSFVTSKNSPPQLVATLTQTSGESYTSTNFKPDFPRQGWVSILFEGPPFAVNRFCYGNTKFEKVYMSYKPVNDFKMSYSTTEEFSTNEIDKTGKAAANSVLTTKDRGSHTKFGRNSKTPYWITLSYNANFSKSVSTSLQYTVP